MRYFIYLSYDGVRYHGWQIQPNGISVQEVLSKALSTLLREPIEVTGAGRTDAGVNASLMVAHFDTTHKADEQLVYRLNKLLPHDIAINCIRKVTPDAHARFSATSRTYIYNIVTTKTPFEPYAYRFPQPLDFALMNEAAQTLFDYTDFTSFSKLHTDVKTNNCRIMKAEWTPVPHQLSTLNWLRRAKVLNYQLSIVNCQLQSGNSPSLPTASFATWCEPLSVLFSMSVAVRSPSSNFVRSSKRKTAVLPGLPSPATPSSSSTSPIRKNSSYSNLSTVNYQLSTNSCG